MDKKKKPFDFTGWQDLFDEVGNEPACPRSHLSSRHVSWRFFSQNMPQQENGYDCGVFVCMVMEGLSRGEEADDFVFDQTNMPYLRQRLSWEIGRQKLS